MVIRFPDQCNVLLTKWISNNHMYINRIVATALNSICVDLGFNESGMKRIACVQKGALSCGSFSSALGLEAVGV